VTDFECSIADAVLRCTTASDGGPSPMVEFAWATAAAMLAGVGAILAAIVAIVLAVKSQSEARRTEAEARRRDASRVRVRAYHFRGPDPSSAAFVVDAENPGAAPIHSLVGQLTVGTRKVTWDPMTFLGAGKSTGVGYLSVTDAELDLSPKLQYWFQDDHGIWWTRDTKGALKRLGESEPNVVPFPNADWTVTSA
jgi:hypothetical protein